MMFMMEVSYVPPQVAALVLAQAAPGNVIDAPAKFEKTFSNCMDAEHTGNEFALLPRVLPYLEYKFNDATGRYQKGKETDANITSGVLDAPKHGKIVSVNTMNHLYYYNAEPGYLGPDKIVFWVEVEGRRFKIIQNLAVVETINDYAPPVCLKMKFGAAPVDSNYAWGAAGIPIFRLDHVGYIVLPGNVIAQTTDEGPDATITLDNSAAGHGWFIDTKPD